MIKKKLIMIICSFVLVGNVIGGCSSTKKANTEIENKEDEAKQVESKQVETNKKDEMIAYIEKDIGHRLVKVSLEEAQNAIGENYINFKNIPERFKEYGIYRDKDSYGPTIEHIWYDPDKFELLTVTEIKSSEPQKDREEAEITFTSMTEDGKAVYDYCSWAYYRSSWGFTKNDVYVHGYMLVNDYNSMEECKKILKSLKQ